MKRSVLALSLLLLLAASGAFAAEPTKAERVTAIKIYMARVTDLTALQTEAMVTFNTQMRALAADTSLTKQPKWLIKWAGALAVMEAVGARQATLAPVPEGFAELNAMVSLLGKEVQSWTTDLLTVGDGLDAESLLRSQVHGERVSRLTTEVMTAARRAIITVAPLFRPDP